MMRAYWFSRRDGTTDYLTMPAAIGNTDRFGGTPILCQCGLHGGLTPFDALQYACGTEMWEVELGGKIVKGFDKCAAQERRYLRRVDLTAVCRRFAAQQALSVIGCLDVPDLIREYLLDEADGKDRADLRVEAGNVSPNNVSYTAVALTRCHAKANAWAVVYWATREEAAVAARETAVAVEAVWVGRFPDMAGKEDAAKAFNAMAIEALDSAYRWPTEGVTDDAS